MPAPPTARYGRSTFARPRRSSATELGHDEPVPASRDQRTDGGSRRSVMTNRSGSGRSDPPTRRARRQLGSPASGIALDPTGKRIAVGDSDGKCSLELPPAARLRGRCRVRPVGSFGLAYLSRAALVMGDDAGVLRRWDPVTGRLSAKREGAHHGRIMGVAASPDGTLVATVGADGPPDLERQGPVTPHRPARRRRLRRRGR